MHARCCTGHCHFDNSNSPVFRKLDCSMQSSLTCLHHGCHASKPPVKCYVSQLTDSKPFVCAGLHEIWEDGQAFKDLRKRLKALSEAKANIEAARKATLKACCMLSDSARNTGCLQRNVMCTLL